MADRGPTKEGQVMGTKAKVERATGLLFGTYRAWTPADGPTWLVVAPATERRAFSVVVGQRGFYICRMPKRKASA